MAKLWCYRDQTRSASMMGAGGSYSPPSIPARFGMEHLVALLISRIPKTVRYIQSKFRLLIEALSSSAAG